MCAGPGSVFEGLLSLKSVTWIQPCHLDLCHLLSLPFLSSQPKEKTNVRGVYMIESPGVKGEIDETLRSKERKRERERTSEVKEKEEEEEKGET